MKRLLFLSTPVGALGSGLGGGVELTLQNLALEMQSRGYEIKILAPENSFFPNLDIVEIPGNLQVPAQSQSRSTPTTMPRDPVIGNMWEYARRVQSAYDLLVNFAFDWLPLYLTPFFQSPIAHFISMGSLSDSLDRIVCEVAREFPGTLGAYTQSQAATFPCAEAFISLGSGIDLSLYHFCEQPQPFLAWVGRIAPEKALEDAVAASQIAGIPLKIFGKIQDRDYWQQIRQQYPQAPVDYLGFFPTQELQGQLRFAQAMLMTPRWLEAFGNVAIEALACGVPVIAYARGGPAEIVRDGQTGFLVKPDSVGGLVAAIERIGAIDRANCRRQAEQEYSLGVWCDRFEAWFRQIIARS